MRFTKALDWCFRHPGKKLYRVDKYPPCEMKFEYEYFHSSGNHFTSGDYQGKWVKHLKYHECEFWEAMKFTSQGNAVWYKETNDGPIFGYNEYDVLPHGADDFIWFIKS